MVFASDDEGRLASLSRPVASESVDIVYDGRSFMQSTVDPATGAVTSPTYSSEGLLQALRRQEGPASPEARFSYLYFAGRPVAQLELDGLGGQFLLYLVTDHLGTPQVALDETGAEVWDAAFEPFGRDSEEATPAGALANGVFLRFPGQWEDGRWGGAAFGAGAFYNVRRWLDPSVARYTKTDPLGLGGGSYYYLYALANPVRNTDPLGLKIVSIDPGLKPYVECALKFGPPQFQEAYHHFDDPWWTGWRIRFQRPERLHAMEVPPKVPKGRRSESLPGSFPTRLFPGEFLIEPPVSEEGACGQLVPAIMHEMLERYYSDTHSSDHIAGLEIGGPHNFATQHDDPTNVCDKCCLLP